METKICVFCKIEKTVDNFFKNGKQPSGKIKYKSECKDCTSKRRIDRYYNILKSFYGDDICCKICGYDRIEVLDLHHVNPIEKEYTVTKIRNHKEEKIISELKKCIPLCPTCHREVHLGITNLQ